MKKRLLFLFLFISINLYSQDFFNTYSNYFTSSNKKYPYKIERLKKFGFNNHFSYNKKDLIQYKDSTKILNKLTSVVIELKKQVDIVSIINELAALPNLNFIQFEVSSFLNDDVKQKIFPKNISLLKGLETISFRGNPSWDLSQLFNEFTKLKKLKNLSFFSFKNDVFLNENLLNIKTIEGIHYNGGFGPKFPTNISKLKKLKTLIIQVNEYQNAKIEISKIKNISDLSINLYKDKSNEMIDIIGHFKSLKRLFIAGKINTPKPLFKLISKNKKLHFLHLQNNKLNELPSSIGKIKNLKTFYSSNNNFSNSLPIEFYNLRKLKSLEIQGSDISTINYKINQLKKLEILKLHFNKINTLPKSISGLKNLKKLYLNYNRIENLPKDIGDLNLTHLSLNNNQISKLPSSITKLVNLDTLYLQANRINSLPKEIGDLKNLKELNLSLNFLSHFPESISNLKLLKRLNIDKNGTKFLPKKFGNLSSLETLNSEYNLLKELPESFGNLNSLKRLVLTNNNLQKLPENFGNLKQLTHLYLYNRKNQSSVFQTYDHTKGRSVNDTLKYNILKNNITKLPESFSNLKNLNYVELSLNENIDSKQFFNLLKKSESKNYSLYLEGCNIKELPNSGWDSLKVKSLDVRNNKISKFPKNITKARFLTSLNLNRNKGTNFYVGSKAQLNILFAEKKFLTFDELPKNNEMVRAYASVANSKSYKKQYQATVEYANKAFAINKNLTHKFLYEDNYIEALFYTKNYKKVIEFADIQIKKDTSRNVRFLNSITPNFTYKAKSQLALGDTIQAIKTFEIVSEKFSGNQWSLMALLSKKIKKDSLTKIYFNKSFEFYKNYLKTNDKDLGYHLSLLEAYVVANNKKEATSYYQSLIKRKITNQNYKYLLQYFNLIINIDDVNFYEKYNTLKEELHLKKYVLSNWSFELLLSWNDFNNNKNHKEKIIKLTNLLSQSK